MAKEERHNKNSKSIWIVAGVIVLFSTIGIIAAASSTNTASALTSSAVAPAIMASDHTEGNSSSSVSLIEYGDFECPACSAYDPVVQQVVAHYGNKIEFAFRNFPLTSIHPDTYEATQAAEAAGLQGQYWQMHDYLYSHQTEWTMLPPGTQLKQYLDNAAASLHLNVDQFNADMDSAQVANKIQSDLNSANAMQLDYTPSFFLNQKQIQNPSSYNAFITLIDQALASSNR